MKTLLALLLTIFFAGLAPVKAATILVSNPTDAEYLSLIANNPVVWQVEMISGFSSTSTHEITVTANGSQSVHHLWSYPEQIGVSYDLAGNLNILAGSTTLNAQPLGDFNMILIRVGDTAIFGPTRLTDATVNSEMLRILEADDNMSFIRDYDQVAITNFGDTPVFTGTFDLHTSGFNQDSIITITGISVPEPSSLVLAMVSSLLFFRHTRPARTRC